MQAASDHGPGSVCLNASAPMQEKANQGNHVYVCKCMNQKINFSGHVNLGYTANEYESFAPWQYTHAWARKVLLSWILNSMGKARFRKTWFLGTNYCWVCPCRKATVKTCNSQEEKLLIFFPSFFILHTFHAHFRVLPRVNRFTQEWSLITIYESSKSGIWLPWSVFYPPAAKTQMLPLLRCSTLKSWLDSGHSVAVSVPQTRSRNTVLNSTVPLHDYHRCTVNCNAGRLGILL